MSAADKTKNTAQDLTGKAKEAASKVTDNESYRTRARPTRPKLNAYFTADA
jgi:hypothetical protein